jgi:formyl-CoA transferase
MRLIGAAGVPAGAVFDTGDLLTEPSFAARGITQTMRHPSGGFVCRLFRCAAAARRRWSSQRPLLGEHNAEVFAE